MESYSSNAKAKLVGIVVSIVVVAGIVLVADHLKSHTASAASTKASTTPTTQSSTASTTTPTTSTATTDLTPTTSTTTSSTSTSSSSTSAYADGTYSASSSYYVPHGTEGIKVSLTLKDGVITDSSIVNSEGDRDSAAYQEQFAASYKSYVTGKSIRSLSLSRVAGASDTTQGFDDALTQIANQAKA